MDEINHFDFMCVNSKQVSKDDEKHTLITDETLDLPSDFFGKQFLERRTVRVQTYWCTDDTGTFYVLRRSLPTTLSSKAINNMREAFVFLPIDNKTDKCLLLFFSEFEYGQQGHPIVFNSWTIDKIKIMRMDLLAAYVEYNKC